jgi:anionic cell wall polymer biosynthesis LytR-Cps2A-Psr (LCP) family protein
MASTYWLVDPRRWATMMGVLILMLLGIILLAFLDLFSVGLREITKGNETAHQEMVQKYLELREKQQREQAVAENSAGESDEEK